MDTCRGSNCLLCSYIKVEMNYTEADLCTCSGCCWSSPTHTHTNRQTEETKLGPFGCLSLAIRCSHMWRWREEPCAYLALSPAGSLSITACHGSQRLSSTLLSKLGISAHTALIISVTTGTCNWSQ